VVTHSIVLLLALLIGVVAGLRTLTAPTVVAWAALLHWINLDGTWASWLGHPVTVTILTILAVIELISDKLPKTPDRLTPIQFGARIILGGFAAAVIGTAWGYTWSGLGSGVVGAVLGTVGGYQARTRLAAAQGHDLSIALLEDAMAILGGFAVASMAAAL
jgi:uncharacterized membrane protein